jgi:hypothetical protein
VIQETPARPPTTRAGVEKNSPGRYPPPAGAFLIFQLDLVRADGRAMLRCCRTPPTGAKLMVPTYLIKQLADLRRDRRLLLASLEINGDDPVLRDELNELDVAIDRLVERLQA